MGAPVVSLVGKERVAASIEHGARCGYGVWRFRPIYRPKSELIETLLKSIDEPVKVVA
jgi:ABC-type cobalt transport system substrate-binding protein